MTPQSTPVELLERHEEIASELQLIDDHDPEVRCWLDRSDYAFTRAVESALRYVPEKAIVPVE